MIDPRRTLLLAAAAGLLSLALPAAHAQTTVTTYSGTDAGVGPGGNDPKSDKALSDFTAAAASFGSQTLLDFEAPVQLNQATFTTNGVQVTGTNNMAGVKTGGDAIVGYNTTGGGSQFLQLNSRNNNNAVTEVFNFTNDDRITAFGAEFTGVGTNTGTAMITFTDNTTETETVAGDSRGGVEFYGFTDTLKRGIKSVTVGVYPAALGVTTSDIIGVDDVRIYGKTPTSAAPEPSQIATLSLGFVLFGGLILTARKRRAAQAV